MHALLTYRRLSKKSWLCKAFVIIYLILSGWLEKETWLGIWTIRDHMCVVRFSELVAVQFDNS